SHAWNIGFTKNWASGTGFQFGWNNFRFKSNNQRSDLNPGWSSNWQIQITQRLLQGFGRAVNARNIKIAKNNLRVSDLVFEQQVIETVASIVKLYWDLVAFAEDVKVKKQALALAKKLYEDNKKQVEIGTLAPIEITSAEAQVARRQQELTAAETALLQQETVIKNALSRTGVYSPLLADARIIPTDRLPKPTTDEMLDLTKLVDTAVRRRPEIEQTRINIENTKIGMAGSRSQLRPALDAMVFYNHNALAGDINSLARPPFIPNPDAFFVGGYGTALKQLLRRNFPDYGFGIQLNIPIHNRSAQADYIRDALQLRQQQLRERQLLNNIRVQVENARIALVQAKALYDAAVKERQLQQETLEAEQKKYALGASTVFFVIQYQRDLAQAQAAEISAMAAYAKAKVDLERAVGRLLETYRISIEEAKAGVVSRPPDLPVAPQG
ncbi:MAG TPA: TolC family protein, partial [Bryobacterales bacterium]|nr:TolC family protein [Bryobacterales bacterium]